MVEERVTINDFNPLNIILAYESFLVWLLGLDNYIVKRIRVLNHESLNQMVTGISNSGNPAQVLNHVSSCINRGKFSFFNKTLQNPTRYGWRAAPPSFCRLFLEHQDRINICLWQNHQNDGSSYQHIFSLSTSYVNLFVKKCHHMKLYLDSVTWIHTLLMLLNYGNKVGDVIDYSQIPKFYKSQNFTDMTSICYDTLLPIYHLRINVRCRTSYVANGWEFPP